MYTKKYLKFIVDIYRLYSDHKANKIGKKTSFK